jgi:hypothetical protein
LLLVVRDGGVGLRIKPKKYSALRTYVFNIVLYGPKDSVTREPVSALTSVVIAAFTVALALTTRGLSQATRGLQDFAALQADDMKQSLAIAARAADGTHRSANVAERTLEQTYAPYLDIAITPKAILHHFPGGGATAQFHSGVFAEYTIVNYGSSPAVVLEIYHGCVKGRGIPKTIEFPPPQSNIHRVITVGGLKESDPISVPFPLDGMLNVKVDEIIWVGIQTRYRDIFGEQYITNSWFTYSQVRASFATYGGPKYNNRRKLTDESASWRKPEIFLISALHAAPPMRARPLSHDSLP